MFNLKRRSLFRQESLERLSSPERLDQMMRVVAPQDWLALLATGGLLTGAIAWSIWGKIPLTLAGKGVLIYPYQVTEVQTAAAGRLQQLAVNAGDRVRRGDLIAQLDQTELQAQIRQSQAKLAALQQQDRQLATLTKQRLLAEQRTLQQKRQTLQQQLHAARTLDAQRQQRDLQSVQKQRQAVRQRLQDARELDSVLQARLTNRRQLQQQGAIAADAVLQAEQEYRNNASQIPDLEAQLRQLESREVEINQTDQESRSRISNFQAEIKALDSQSFQLRQQTVEATVNRRNQIQDLQRAIAQWQLQVKTNGKILSPTDGRILEISTTVGQVLAPGTRLATIESVDPTDSLVNLVYFPIKDGKQIQVGMPVQTTPDPIKREEFGGIRGQIQEIAQFPVTKSAIATAVGSAEIADQLVSPGGQIGAIVRLETDPTTNGGYRWTSSRGASLPLTPGTTTTVEVRIGEQAPIYFLLPILRNTTGIGL